MNTTGIVVAEILRLDPFQMVRSFTAPEETGVETFNHAWVQASDEFFNYNLIRDCLNGPPFCTGASIPFASYKTTFAFRLSALILTCDQAVFEVRGQTSGLTRTVDINGFFTSLGWDCFNPLCSSGCHHKIGDEAIFLTTSSAPGFWNTGLNPSSGQWTIDQYTAAPLGFQAGECLDLSFASAPKLPITSITQRNASTVWVATSGALQPDESWVTIEGTQNYDGGYKINDPGSGRFWISKPYVADEAVGTIQAKYDGPVATGGNCT